MTSKKINLSIASAFVAMFLMLPVMVFAETFSVIILPGCEP